MKNIIIILSVVALIVVTYFLYITIQSSIKIEHNAQPDETTYSIPNKIKITLHKTGLNKGIISYRILSELHMTEQISLISTIMPKVLQDTHQGKDLNTLFWRNMDSYPEMSKRLALAAANSPMWNSKLGQPKFGHENTFVINIANQDNIYFELKDLFKRYGLQLKVVGIEKVFISRADTLSFSDWLIKQGVKKDDRLPYNSLVWFSINKMK